MRQGDEWEIPDVRARLGRGLLRLFFRVPVLVHRLGFGGWERFAGLQWMLITTTGRRSGRPHRVMVDVLGYDEPTDTYYVEAYGRRADWYRNIQARPAFQAQVGCRRFYTRAVLRLVGLRSPTEDALRAMGRSTLALAVRPQPA